MGTLITAGIVGLGTLLFMWLDKRQAQQDHDKRAQLESYVSGDAKADAAEQEIKASAETARNDAAPDFTTLR